MSARLAIADSASYVRNLIDQVSVPAATAQGVEQVAQAIAQTEKVTQTTAATAEESAAASEELSAQAETAKEIVRSLEALAGSAGRTTVPPPAGRPVAKKQAPSTAARPQTKVVKLASRPVRTAEQEIPFEDTGTFGKF